jgi:DNA-binding response OmpR family regulator
MLILIVEDEVLSALSMKWELEHAGHRVLGPATSYEEALQLARRDRPTLALVDIDLEQPGDGVKLARAFREMDIPLLFVSAQSALANRYRELAVGHIRKPYDLADLPRSVDVVVSRLRGGNPPATLPRSLRLFQ